MESPIAYLDIVPVEIWLVCWMFASTRQRRRLSLVCRLFRSLCFPSLIERQSADIKLTLRDWSRASTGITGFTVPTASIAPQDRNAVRVLTTFLATLGLYQNLITLNMQGMTIDTSLRQTLSSLSRLRQLILDGCDINPPNGVLLTLQRFTISGTGKRTPGVRASNEGTKTELPLGIVFPEHLLELNLHAGVQSASLIAGLGDMTFFYLQYLSVHALFDVDVLLDILKRCPRLESLAIPSISSGGRTPLPKYLPQHIVPLLRNLTAPCCLVELFTLNRPVSAITVLTQQPDNRVTLEETKDVFISISHSSTAIQSLVLPCTTSTIQTLAFIASLFPVLDELSMDIPEKDRPRRRFTCGSQSFADLREGTRDPELNDEAAFDGLPANEISDSEDPLAPVPRNQSTHMNSSSTPLWADPPDRRNRIASLIHSEHLYQKMLTVISFQPAAKEDPPLPVIPSGTYSTA
ncbi:hypothetical protein B0H13DRAFT_2563477 [Mycena leptocephala]|nr:hypothetical protein B0H13DRAFT_2563477 [Mycena leptocephala]